MSAVLVAQPHERRVQRFAYGALLATAALAVVIALQAQGALFGVQVPLLATLALALVGAALGALATMRRSAPIAFAAGALLVLAVAPGGSREPGIVGYALALAFAAALVSFVELVHMTQRYERAHRAVEQEGVPEANLDRVTDEAVKTLGTRVALAGGAVAVVMLTAIGLAAAGPRLLQAGVETAAPLGVAVLGLFALGGAALYVLARGAKLRAEDPSRSPEVVADVE